MEQSNMENGLQPTPPGWHDLAASVTSTHEPGPWSSARKALRQVPWLQGVPVKTLDALAGQAVLHRVPPGSMLFDQAETPTFAQILLSGSIELLGVRDQVETLVELLRPVDLVIPAAVISGQPYLLRARIYEEAQIVLIRAEAFRDAIGSDHALCGAILGCLSAQFRRQVRHAKNLKLRSAEERVGCYLVSLLGESNTAITIRLPIEKGLVASQLGMTRETFSRALSGMAKFGIVVRGEIIHIADSTAARTRFPLDPLIDGLEPIKPHERKS
jgi:CRP/FNR family transcriptional regulator, transcriptional activator FtrB